MIILMIKQRNLNVNNTNLNLNESLNKPFEL